MTFMYNRVELSKEDLKAVYDVLCAHSKSLENLAKVIKCNTDELQALSFAVDVGAAAIHTIMIKSP